MDKQESIAGYSSNDKSSSKFFVICGVNQDLINFVGRQQQKKKMSNLHNLMNFSYLLMFFLDQKDRINENQKFYSD
jgi:hypothetical protein